MKVKDNLAAIRTDMEKVCMNCGRKMDDIQVIAVTKYVSSERTEEAIQAGISHIGENRLEGIIKKQEQVKGNAKWHFIGSLQTRKVKDVIGIADYIHSLDRLSLAREIQKRANSVVKCFLQINASGEESKHGMPPEEAIPFLNHLAEEGLDKIEIIGLMTMAPFTDDEEIIRGCFRRTAELRDEIIEKGFPFAPCRELSMGMSNDYRIAIEEGSTYIRIGTALVGEDS